MSKTTLALSNLRLAAGEVRRLRKALHSPSNSGALRRVIDERLAVEAGPHRLQNLLRLDGCLRRHRDEEWMTRS